MSQNLGIAPLRSLVAVADCGGFQRAATALYLSQAGVSQHLRRLESALGRTLIERDGRASRFTAEGEELLTEARRILAAHDEQLRSFGVNAAQALVIGSAEHAAAQLLPELTLALSETFPDCRVRFRIDGGPRLRSGLADGRIDLALLLGPTGHPGALPVGELGLSWYSAPGWVPSGSIPLVAFGEPCALRARALETLPGAVVVAEAAHLAGLQAAVRAGRGVGLMATLARVPDGLVARDDLPPAEPIGLSVVPRRGLPPAYATGVVAALAQLCSAVPSRHSEIRR